MEHRRFLFIDVRTNFEEAVAAVIIVKIIIIIIIMINSFNNGSSDGVMSGGVIESMFSFNFS